MQEVTRGTVLLGYKPLESSSFGDRTEMLGGYVAFQPGRASKYSKKNIVSPCQLLGKCLKKDKWRP